MDLHHRPRLRFWCLKLIQSLQVRDLLVPDAVGLNEVVETGVTTLRVTEDVALTLEDEAVVTYPTPVTSGPEFVPPLPGCEIKNCPVV